MVKSGRRPDFIAKISILWPFQTRFYGLFYGFFWYAKLKKHCVNPTAQSGHPLHLQDLGMDLGVLLGPTPSFSHSFFSVAPSRQSRGNGGNDGGRGKWGKVREEGEGGKGRGPKVRASDFGGNFQGYPYIWAPNIKMGSNIAPS